MKKHLNSIVLILISSVLIACGTNFFLVPHHLINGGISGISLITSYFTPFSMGTLYFGFNLPLIIYGWFVVGRKFILYTLLSVGTVTLALSIVPVKMLANDAVLSSIYAGILVGVGTGLCFRAGGSSGGFDVLGAIISRYRDMSVGNIIIVVNGAVLFASGYLTNNWNITLISAVSIYLTGKVLNMMYTDHEKVTLYIVTNEAQKLTDALFKLHLRGVTKLSAEGAYSGVQSNVLMTVVTRYEYIQTKEIIHKTDPNAFVNVSQTVEILGNFRK